MSIIEIIEVKTKAERNLFARFGNELYKDCKYYVPDLEYDILDTFNPKSNAAYEFCESQMFLAKRDGKIVGRVAAIINRRANETWDVKNVRFGYLDFIDDEAVSAALLKAVEHWGRQRGMKNCQGPMGFTDFDKEGMLIEGFDELGSMTAYYNYPYYPQHMEKLGYTKEADWVQIRVAVPDETPARFTRVGELVAKRFGLKIVKPTKKMLTKEGYGVRILDLLNEAYAPLFGFSALSPKQKSQYVDTYLKMLDVRMLTTVENADGDIVCVGITMGSISHALQKSGGKLLPFGWYHLLKSMKFKLEDTVEMLLIGVKPDYQGKGVNALLFTDLIPIYIQSGFKWAETGPQLEDNFKELNQWEVLNPTFPKRRRCYHRYI